MDRSNILIGALAGAIAGAIVGACLPSDTGRRLIDSASEGIKDVTDTVKEYAKENLPGGKKASRRRSYQDSM